MLTFTPLDVITVVTAVVVLGALGVFMLYTKMGKAMRAVENDALVATITGVPTQKVRYVAFFIGSVIVAIAATLVVLDKGLEPHIGTSAVLIATVAVIMGGVGSHYGAALAGLMLGVAENMGSLADSFRVEERHLLYYSGHIYSL